MGTPLQPDFEKEISQSENRLFFSQCLKHPLQMGTAAPISHRLASQAANFVDQNGIVIELGAGTGRLTRALLKKGVKPENLWLIELDATLCTFLEKTLPFLPECAQKLPHIIHGDATNLEELIPPSLHGRVATVISSIPFMYLKESVRQDIADASFRVMPPKTPMYHVTYNPKSPLAFANDLVQKRVVSLWFNLPPAFVWQYQKKE
jgi:phosphatidylethanolamine/phosphatidyl-N-methylethanolamine N-methyltransferase